jgi:hypothetical protein
MLEGGSSAIRGGWPLSKKFREKLRAQLYHNQWRIIAFLYRERNETELPLIISSARLYN